MQSLQRFLTRSRTMALLSIVLVGVTGITWWQIARSAPVARHLEAGAQFLQKGQVVDAEKEWRQVVQLDPSNVEAWEQLSNLHFAAENWRAAQDASQNLLKLRPDEPNVRSRLAMCALKLGDNTAASRYAQDALKRNPDDTEALRVVLTLAQINGQQDEWFQNLQHLAKLEPRDNSVAIALANEWLERAEYDKARVLATRILQEDANLTQGYYLRGLTYFQQNPDTKQLQLAEADFKKTLELNPDQVEAHRYLGRIYMLLDRTAEAIQQFEAIGRGRPYASAHLLELSNAYRRMGDVDKAELLRKRFVLLEETNRRVTDLRERLIRNPTNFDDHLQMGRLLLQSVSESEATYYLYAYRYAQDQLLGVSFYANKALEIRPNDPQAKALIGQIEREHLRYLQAGQQALARKDYKQAQEQLWHAALIRPDEPRTQIALKEASAHAAKLQSVAP